MVLRLGDHKRRVQVRPKRFLGLQKITIIYFPILSTTSLYLSNLAISDKLYFFPILLWIIVNAISLPVQSRHFGQTVFFSYFLGIFVNYCQRHLSTGPILPFRTNCIFSYFLGIFLWIIVIGISLPVQSRHFGIIQLIEVSFMSIYIIQGCFKSKRNLWTIAGIHF